MKKPHIYLLSNKKNTVIYTGVTSNLEKRIYEHKSKKHEGFTSKYNCTKLVYFEEYQSIEEAIKREKQIKSGSRQKKENLINQKNPMWKDLAEEWIFHIK